MSRENVEAVQRWMEVYNRRDIEGLIELTDMDIQFRSIFAAIETGGFFRGHPGVFEYFEALDDAYERFQLAPHDLLDAGAAALMVGDADWRGKGSGAEGTTPIFVAFWLRAGKVLRVETFTDSAQAKEAVGIRE